MGYVSKKPEERSLAYESLSFSLRHRSNRPSSRNTLILGTTQAQARQPNSKNIAFLYRGRRSQFAFSLKFANESSIATTHILKRP